MCGGAVNFILFTMTNEIKNRRNVMHAILRYFIGQGGP